MTVDRLRTLHTRYLGQYPNLKEANQMYVTITIKDADNNTIQTFKEFYVSGSLNRINKYFGQNTIPVSPPDDFIPVNPTGNVFEVFVLKAKDLDKARKYDTEVKMLFNFIENHLGAGQRFEIDIESTRYSCESCQRYMFALLQQLTEAQGKVVEYTFAAHPEARRLKDVKKIIDNWKIWK